MKPRVLVVGYLSIDACETAMLRHDEVPGGAGLYAAVAAVRSGAEVALAAACGADYPESWLAALAQFGVDVSLVERRAGPTRRARLSYAQSGQRSSDHHAEAGWWACTQALRPPVPERIAGLGAVVACAMPVDLLATCIARARESDAMLVFDTSEAFAHRDRVPLLEALDAVDVIAASCEETRLLLPDLGDDAAARHLAGPRRRVLQKRGARGAVAIESDAGVLVHLAAPPVAVVDPTGAGDATVGALAALLAGGADFMAASRAALAVGALVVSGVGPAALGFAPRSS